jgi:hypothetical protein
MKLLIKISKYMQTCKTPRTPKQVAERFMAAEGHTRDMLNLLTKQGELIKLNTWPRQFINRYMVEEDRI